MRWHLIFSLFFVLSCPQLPWTGHIIYRYVNNITGLWAQWQRRIVGKLRKKWKRKGEGDKNDKWKNGKEKSFVIKGRTMESCPYPWTDGLPSIQSIYNIYIYVNQTETRRISVNGVVGKWTTLSTPSRKSCCVAFAHPRTVHTKREKGASQ